MKLTNVAPGVRASIVMAGVLLAVAHAHADAPAAGRPIYRCEVRGQSVFSDRPCGSDASAYEADTSRVSITQSAPVSARESSPVTDSKPAARRRGSAGSSAAALARHAATCEKIEAGLREVRARMRSGYTAKQGERLKERQRSLQARRRAARCS